MFAAIGDAAELSELEGAAPFALARTRPGVLLGLRGDCNIYERTQSGCRSRDRRAVVTVRTGSLDVMVGPAGGRALFGARLEHGGWMVTDELAWLLRWAARARRPDLNVAWLGAQMLFVSPHDPTATSSKQVSQLTPGGTTTFSTGAPFRFVPLASRNALRPSTLESVASVLRDVVARNAELPGGHAVLTGGIDSSSLAALLCERTTPSLVTMELLQPDQDRPYVERLAAHLGRPCTVVSPEAARAEVPPDLTIDGLPLLSPTIPHALAATRAALRGGARNVWTGVGGDDLFEASPRAVSSLVLSGHPIEAARTALLTASDGRAKALMLNVVWGSFRAAAPAWAVYLLARPWRRPPALQSWAGPALQAVGEEGWARACAVRPQWELSREEKVAYFMDRYFDLIATYRHVFERWVNALRIDPYLDPDVVREVCGLPEHELVRHGLSRAPLRGAVRGMLPEAVWNRTEKASFEASTVAALANVTKEQWRSLATPTALGDLGLVEPALFRAEYDAFERDVIGSPRAWLRLWPTIACEAFVRGQAGLPGRFVPGPTS